ncbi:hypothetical protein PIB30_065538 [Stylosanthes scabra]|uniref:Uncharacterized protein n=1 Tax=Stylosanthes scabra TaxID=79078 RepID=A0ABU6TM94_9FABA|nr:hypothetical protein [Stylosanthes scabra]
MAWNGLSPSAKGKAKVYGPPTRASHRLAALRSQPVANRQPETPVTPTIGAPTSTLPPKKHPIPKKAGEGTSKVASRSFRWKLRKKKLLHLAVTRSQKRLKKSKKAPKKIQ